MTIIPAIDVLDGACVRLRKGDYTQKTIFHTDPAAVARQWADAGAKLIHIVDLNGAKNGGLINAPVVEKIRGSVSCRLEIGGGIRTMEDVDRYMTMGIDRVILGTVLFKNQSLAAKSVDRYGEKMIAGVDTKNGKPSVEGWLCSVDTPLNQVFSDLYELGFREIIHTEISKDGMMSGFDTAGAEAVLSLWAGCYIASGGVTTLDDLSAIARLNRRVDGRIAGAIVGRALYDGAMTLEAALQTVSPEAAA